MKKFFMFIGIIVVFSSCSVQRYVYGDVSIMNNNGELLRYYENSLLETYVDGKMTSSAIKVGGSVNFIDDNDVNHFVSGGIIIVDNIKTTTGVYNLLSSNKKSDNEKEKDIADFKSLKKRIYEKEKGLKKIKNNVEEYKKQKEEINELKESLNFKSDYIWKTYGINPQDIK